MESLLLRTLIATGIAFAGALLAVGLGELATRRLALLVWLAAAALLLVTFVDILPEAKALLSWPAFGAGILSGAALFWAISKVIHPICPACAASAFAAPDRERLHKTALLLTVALAIHSTVDGLAIAAGEGMTGPANVAVWLAVALHKLPEGLALALLLLGSGYRRAAALAWTLGVETTTVAGGWLGDRVLHGAPPLWLGLLFAHVGGGFLYLVASTAGAVTRRPKIPAPLLDSAPRKLL